MYLWLIYELSNREVTVTVMVVECEWETVSHVQLTTEQLHCLSYCNNGFCENLSNQTFRTTHEKHSTLNKHVWKKCRCNFVRFLTVR